MDIKKMSNKDLLAKYEYNVLYIAMHYAPREEIRAADMEQRKLKEELLKRME